ncbi:hypothetical protein KKG31_04670 [Patescibacteria group bacterium]|nr:hypothetical protein [Patescibacteria group bacterium]MBU1758425.1 hypothetical protein [Patescibacteria group bacterium]
MYSGDYEKLKGRTDLGESGIDIYTLGINELKDFSKLLQMTLDIDKKKTEEMMTVAMLKLEDEDFRNLYNHLK